MHVALVANTAWLDEELAQMRCLVVGLMGEQARITQIVPEGVPLEDLSGFGATVRWWDCRWPWLRRLALGRTLERLGELDVDLIHALDGRVWDGALTLARRLEVPAVLTASSVLDLSLLDRVLHTHADARLMFAASTAPLAHAIAERVGSHAPVQHVAPGVHLAEQIEPPTDSDTPLCAVISGPAMPDPEYIPLFEAIRAVTASYPQAQFFLDTQGLDPHALWRLAERHGLLANISMVPRRLGHHELLLRAHLLVHPMQQSRSRGLTLQAMAAGIPVIARTDPWIDYLIDRQTAWTVDEPDARQWEQLIRRAIERRDEAFDLGRRARQFVSQHHVAAQQVESTFAMYRSLVGEAIQFPG